MPIPASWSKQRQTLRYTTAEGWELTQEWRGRSGPNKTFRDQWLANFTGYSSLEFEESMELDGAPTNSTNPFDAECVARITWPGMTSEPPDPEDPEGGLLSRSWSLVGTDEQRRLDAHPNVQKLADPTQGGYKELPGQIRDGVAMYKAKTQQILSQWNGLEPKPTLPPFLVPVTVAALSDEVDAYASLLLRDENTTFAISAYTLRKSEQVASWSTLVVSHLNKNRWHNWTALTLTEPTLAGTGLIQTAGLENLIWLKKTPEVNIASGGNYELTQEYFGGVYPAVGSPQEKEFIFLFGTLIT